MKNLENGILDAPQRSLHRMNSDIDRRVSRARCFPSPCDAAQRSLHRITSDIDRTVCSARCFPSPCIRILNSCSSSFSCQVDRLSFSAFCPPAFDQHRETAAWRIRRSANFPRGDMKVLGVKISVYPVLQSSSGICSRCGQLWLQDLFQECC